MGDCETDTTKAYDAKPFVMVYFKYDYDAVSKKYHNIRKKKYVGYHCVNHPISLVMNFNVILGNPYDESDLLSEMMEARKNGTFDDYVNNHPLVLRWVHIGKRTSELNIEEMKGRERNLHDLFEMIWRPSGLRKLPHLEYCCCCYGLKSYDKLEINHYIFDVETGIQVVIGDDCINRFKIKQRCKDCGTSLTLAKSTKYNMLCKDCQPPKTCIVCFEVIDDNKDVCDMCQSLGRKRFKQGKNKGKSYLTVFKENPAMKDWHFINERTTLGQFIQRMNIA